MRRRRHWAAVEVKTSVRAPDPEVRVDRARCARLRRALTALAPGLRPSPRTLAIDLVGVVLAGPAAGIRHHPGDPFHSA